MRDLWYDVSPMRPDEFARQMAGKWSRAEAIQQAFRKGKEAADREIQSAKETKERQEESLKKLKEQYG